VTATVERFADLARLVLDRPARLGDTRLVAVDGPSGAGKSAFADRLAAALAEATGEPVPVVHTDDLLDGWFDQLTFWPRLERWNLAPLAGGRAGRYRRYDWVAGRFGTDWQPVPPAPVVILDGVSTARAEVRDRLTLAVFVTAPAQLRRERVLSRDGPAVSAYLQEWSDGEDRHFAAEATAHYADMMVDGAGIVPFEPDLEFVRIQPMDADHRVRHDPGGMGRAHRGGRA
jgi:uridine kinase